LYFCTNDIQLIDEFLQSSADNQPNQDYEDLYSFTLQRTRVDAPREKERVASAGHPMRGTRPPVGANGTLDFDGATLDELARYVLETFAADEVGRQGDEYMQTISPDAKLQKSATAHIDNEYFAVLDAESAQNKSILLVHIPGQAKETHEGSGEFRYTRNWVPRENYTHLANWEDDDANDEMKAARLAFKEGYRVDMCQLKEESIINYAQQADEDGIFSEESANEHFRRVTGQ
jgi:hypothetical protein